MRREERRGGDVLGRALRPVKYYQYCISVCSGRAASPCRSSNDRIIIIDVSVEVESFMFCSIIPISISSPCKSWHLRGERQSSGRQDCLWLYTTTSFNAHASCHAVLELRLSLSPTYGSLTMCSPKPSIASRVYHTPTGDVAATSQGHWRLGDERQDDEWALHLKARMERRVRRT